MVDYTFDAQAAVDIATGLLVTTAGAAGSVYASEADAQTLTNPLTVTLAGGVPATSISISAIGQTPKFTVADHYHVWWSSGGVVVHLVSFDGLLEVVAAAEAAATALAVGVVRKINGQVPDENGAITISGGGGGSGVVIVPPLPAPVPEGTPANVLIARSESAPPVNEMDVVGETATTTSATSAGNISLAVPSGVVVGDYLVAAVTCHTQNGTSTAPAGWTKIQELPTNTSDFRTTTIWGKPIVTAGDIPGSAQLFSWNVAGRVAGAMFRVTGVNLTTPVLVTGAVGTRTAGTYTIPALTASADGLILQVAVGQIANAATPLPLVRSQTMESFVAIDSGPDGGGSRTILGIAWSMTAAATDWPSGTVATNDNTANAFGGQVIALRPAA